ncbi:MAG: NADH-quinone oxidoreductase subunit C, partial [Rhodoferax sp.]
MTTYAVNPQTTKLHVETALGDLLKSSVVRLGELTIAVDAAHYLQAAEILRDDPNCRFEQLMDLCGVDYSTYRDEPQSGLRFCVV